MRSIATANAIYILSGICMVGGSSLISSNFRENLHCFLQHITEIICKRGKARSKDECVDNSSNGGDRASAERTAGGEPSARQAIGGRDTPASHDNVRSTNDGETWQAGVPQLRRRRLFHAVDQGVSLFASIDKFNVPSSKFKIHLFSEFIYLIYNLHC